MNVRPPDGPVPRPARTVLTLALAGLVIAAAGVAATPAQAHDRSDVARVGNAVLEWNVTASRAAAAACIAPLDNPLDESRIYAMTQLAIHDALNAVDRRAESYGPTFRAHPGADPRAAVAAAAHDTLVSAIAQIGEPFPQACRDAGIAVVEDFYREQVDSITDGRARSRGLAAGRRASAGIVDRRVNDGADTPLVVADHPQGTAPGQWRFTQGNPFAFAPGWGDVRPFGLRWADQFEVAGPQPLTSRRYARDLNEVKRLGGDGVATPTSRTPGQTETALFWLESSPTMWNRVARALARSQQLDGWQQARLLGQLNVALADGYIASFDQKYTELFWRPETAIRQADGDRNPRTAADPGWTPLRTTPAIPDHDSAHAVEGGAAAGVLMTFFGTDRLRFAVCSDTLPDRPCGSADPKERQYTSVTQAARENAVSRVYVGFHFRWATEVGTQHGLDIGRWAATRILRTS